MFLDKLFLIKKKFLKKKLLIVIVLLIECFNKSKDKPIVVSLVAKTNIYILIKNKK